MTPPEPLRWRKSDLPLNPSLCRIGVGLGAAESDFRDPVDRDATGDAYQELVLGTGSPGPEAFERQIDAALVLLRLEAAQPR